MAAPSSFSDAVAGSLIATSASRGNGAGGLLKRTFKLRQRRLRPDNINNSNFITNAIVI